MPGPSPDTRFPAYVVRRRGDDLAGSVELLGEHDLPPGELLVEVGWSGVNYKDGMVTVAGNRVARGYPLVPGVDLAGTVADSTDPAWAPGTAILCCGHDLGVGRHGGFARYARVPADWALDLPPPLDARRAMALGTAGFTAALSVDAIERHGVAPGAGPVLVTGASGGVGSVAVALLAGRGYEVVASSGKATEHDWLRQLGATDVIGREELADGSDRVLGAQRWAGAVDCVGGATLASVVRTLRYGGAVAASGLTGGTVLETTVYPFVVRAVALVGIDSVLTPNALRRATWQRLASELGPAAIDRLVARTVGLDGLDGALDDIRHSRVRGRILVDVAAR